MIEIGTETVITTGTEIGTETTTGEMTAATMTETVAMIEGTVTTETGKEKPSEIANEILYFRPPYFAGIQNATNPTQKSGPGLAFRSGRKFTEVY